MATTPTQRTIDRLRKEGWVCQSVEKKAPKPAGIVGGRMAFHLTTTIDLFGCIDILACKPDGGILAIQATSNNGGNVSARLHKSEAETKLKAWLEAGGRFQVWGWWKPKKRTGRALWHARRLEVQVRDGALVHWEMQDSEDAAVARTITTLTRKA